MSEIIKESPKVSVKELKQIMGTSQVPSVDYTVIQPGIALGGKTAAKDTDLLSKLGVTHIINTAYDATGKGNFIYVDVNEDYYKKRNFDCKYLGIRAIDTPRFKLDRFFDQAVEFIDDAKNTNGVVYIHCVMGMSRSATIVIIYLMIKHNMSAKEASEFVRKKREIFPNDGFLQQIVELEHRLLQNSNLLFETEVNSDEIVELENQILQNSNPVSLSITDETIDKSTDETMDKSTKELSITDETIDKREGESACKSMDESLDEIKEEIMDLMNSDREIISCTFSQITINVDISE